MEPPPSEPRLSPFYPRKDSEQRANGRRKSRDQQNCPYRIARPELNYNLASLGGGKNGGGTVLDSPEQPFTELHKKTL